MSQSESAVLRGRLHTAGLELNALLQQCHKAWDRASQFMLQLATLVKRLDELGGTL